MLSLQKFPKDGVKKLVIQMEKQKLIYEEKALVALQKATQEKAEALSKAETLQVKQTTFFQFDTISVSLTYFGHPVIYILCSHIRRSG